MRREELTLIMLALADGQSYTPVQIQKAIFLVSDRAAYLFNDESRYNFQPHHYGPFDRDVYEDIQSMKWQGLTKIATDSQKGWNTYSVTKQGAERAEELKAQLDTNDLNFLSRVSGFVRKLSFAELVSAIYNEYPRMREKSIFVRG